MAITIYLGGRDGLRAPLWRLPASRCATSSPSPEVVAAALVEADAVLTHHEGAHHRYGKRGPELRIISTATTGSTTSSAEHQPPAVIPVYTLKEDPHVLRNITRRPNCLDAGMAAPKLTGSRRMSTRHMDRELFPPDDQWPQLGPYRLRPHRWVDVTLRTSVGMGQPMTRTRRFS